MKAIDVCRFRVRPRPTLPNVNLTGGTATGPAKPLPPEFQSFMDSAKEGVVIVSFGSYVLDLPQHISDKNLQVLLQLPMKSVSRSNLTSSDPKKILTVPWIPQNDLLGHPHTKVFVSHCGNSGQYEALYHTVPIVATPLFDDQRYNAERIRVKGFAEVLGLYTCTAE
ncbi:UDP-glucuronosyltransferase 2A2-like [Babylonia areolata]|uniref:UDP-glucuronosyltransferase 2A2-like n=1 Tax=Babylonia areolata TaxID=304850 RepID=UPI003FD3BF2F